MALAESCTGGLISSQIVHLDGVSSFYHGSVVSYSSKVKREVLNVPPTLIQTMGEVSEPVAVAMAEGVRTSLSSDWALSVTGVAGPGGGTEQKPVGTVCFAIVGPGYKNAVTKNFNLKNRNEIQWASADFALSFLLESFNS